MLVANAGKQYPVFEVWRLDDNANQFLVVTFNDRASAEKRIAELTAHGHRQMYCVKEVTA